VNSNNLGSSLLVVLALEGGHLIVLILVILIILLVVAGSSAATELGEVNAAKVTATCSFWLASVQEMDIAGTVCVSVSCCVMAVFYVPMPGMPPSESC
jgi:hypothetical protein